MIKKITDGIKYWGQLVLLPIYWLSFLIPRDKKIWLFGSTFGKRFADNPRYFYLYISQHKNELGIRTIWISHDKKIVEFLKNNGYEAYSYHSAKGIWYALRGKVYLFDNYSKDINFWQSGGAVKINMWHGIPLKKIQHDNIFDKFRHPKNLLEKLKNFPRNISDEKPGHYVLTTSDKLISTFSSAFKTRNVIAAGYPRNDILISDKIKNIYTNIEKDDLAYISQQVEKKGLKKIIFYMPTFRASETEFFKNFDIEDFNEFLKENGILFCIKLHPKSKLRKKFDKLSGKNILIIDADADPYVFLKCTDVLITDYSSVYFDFLLTEKPIIFFDYDLEEYLHDSREMYFDYESVTPGDKVEDYDGLKSSILSACYNEREYMERYDTLKDTTKQIVYNEIHDIACAKLLNELRKML